MTAGTDSTSARLIAAAQAIQLAERLPDATAKTVVNRAKAARAAIVACEPSLALSVLRDIEEVVADCGDAEVIEVVKRRIEELRRPVEFAARRS
jgi:hypothetical protein